MYGNRILHGHSSESLQEAKCLDNTTWFKVEQSCR